jgi:hypothetical protein
VKFRDKVQVLVHEQSRPETVVRIETRDGQAFEAAVNVAIPMRDLGAQWQKLEDKFLTLAGPVLGETRARSLAATCRTLEQLDDVGSLATQLQSIH